MEKDDINLQMCDGCTERDEKIKKQSIEIDNLKRDLEYQKSLVRYFASSSSSTTFPALKPVREEANETDEASTEEMAIDAIMEISDSSDNSNSEPVNNFKHTDVDKNDKQNEFQVMNVECAVSFPAEKPTDPVPKRA